MSWKSKLRSPFGNTASLDEDVVVEREEPDESDAEADTKVKDNLITKMVTVDELENMAGDSDEAKEKSSEEGENVLVQTVQLEKEPSAEEKDESALFESTDKEKNEPEKEEESDSISDLFSDDEEEENPLASLITSLPDVTATELLEEMKEVQVLLREWQQG
ncbi:hypothetical protein ACFLU9_02095 [Chloroflexota bacterium]